MSRKQQVDTLLLGHIVQSVHEAFSKATIKSVLTEDEDSLRHHLRVSRSND